MKFLVTDSVYWDTSKQVQSEAAQKWLRDLRQTPARVEKDEYGRPYRWTWETERARVVVEHIFVFKHSTDWSLDSITINVIKK